MSAAEWTSDDLPGASEDDLAKLNHPVTLEILDFVAELAGTEWGAEDKAELVDRLTEFTHRYLDNDVLHCASSRLVINQLSKNPMLTLMGVDQFMHSAFAGGVLFGIGAAERYTRQIRELEAALRDSGME